jgi:hypothetical protein
MTRIEFWEPSGETMVPGKGMFRDRYAPGAFAGSAGKRVPFRLRPGGEQAGWATVIDVRIDPDGYGATWVLDVEAPDGGDFPAGRSLAASGMSFSFWPEQPPGAPHDPVAARPPVVRWRDLRE